MTRQVSGEIFAAYLEETLGYLPVIRESIERYCTDPTCTDDIQLAHRLAHIIKGASSMVGMSDLSDTAHRVEHLLNGLATGVLILDEDALIALQTDFEQLEDDLTALAAGDTPQRVAEHDTLPPNFDVPDPVCLSELEVPPAAPQAQDDDWGTVEEPIDPDMLEVFQLEAEDHLRIISDSLTLLESAPENYEALREVRRSTHTLKGAAGVVGARTLSRVAHRMEDALDRLFDGDLRPTVELVNLLLRATDILENLARGIAPATLRANIEETTSALARHIAALPPASHHDASAETFSRMPSPIRVVEDSAPERQAEDAHSPVLAAGSDAAHDAQRVKRVVRVPLERLDSLVKLIGELVINRSEQERHLLRLTQEVEELRHSTERLRRVSDKIEYDYEASSFDSGRGVISFVTHPHRMSAESSSGAARLPNASFDTLGISPFRDAPVHLSSNPYGFDELEFDRYTEFHRLTRELAETTSDATSVQDELASLLTDFEGVLTRQRRLTSEVQESLMRVRMVPLATLSTRLGRAVRLAAEAEEKEVELVIAGEAVELDTTVLDALADPLLHLLRNGVAHGIERPEVRRAIGKPARGTITLRAANEGTQVALTISDDGAGIDARALSARAVEGGFVPYEEAATFSERDTLALIFMPGLSTARRVSEISGRGVGMDVVKDAVSKLGGALDLESSPGAGTTFRISLPLTLAATRAVLVRAGGESYALTLSVVEQITRVERTEVEDEDGAAVVRFAERSYPLLHFGAWLGARGGYTHADRNSPVMLLRIGDASLALVVDDLTETREIVIKPLGTHLRRVRGIIGATILGDGAVVPVINPHDLVSREDRAVRRQTAPAVAVRPRAHQTAHALTVMIVDDSPSVRRVMTNMIEGAGWQHLVAKDGLDALEILHGGAAAMPDVILLDIEMPRMDGYELLATLRQSETTRSIPVVMITSRTGEKHRRKAFDLGASEYLSKPYNEEALTAIVRKLSAQVEA